MYRKIGITIVGFIMIAASLLVLPKHGSAATLERWDKYSVKEIKIESWVEDWQTPYVDDNQFWNVYDSYYYDTNLPGYATSGSNIRLVGIGSFGYVSYGTGGGGGSTEYGVKRYTTVVPTTKTYRYHVERMSVTKNKVKDQKVQADIVANSGTYPNDGIHTDGFWYVKTGTVNRAPTISVISLNKVLGPSSGNLVISGNVEDLDGNSLSLQMTIGGVTKYLTIASGSPSQVWQLSWSIGELPEGNYSGFKIYVADGLGGTADANFISTITVDKTPPSKAVIKVGN